MTSSPKRTRQRDLFGKPIPETPESKIHASIVEYLKLNGHPKLLFFHSPQGALERVSQRVQFAKLGTLPGLADLVLVLPGGQAAFLEVKGAIGFMSEGQQAFQARCALLGLRYRMVRTLADAIEVFREWGALRR